MKKMYTKGIYANAPRENTPDFVKGSIDIKADTFLQWINDNPGAITDKGYIKLQITTAYSDVEYNGDIIKKKGDWEVTMNDFFYKESNNEYKAPAHNPSTGEVEQKINVNDLPFN